MDLSLTAKEAEIDANLDHFLELLPELMATHAGQFALLRFKTIAGFYLSAIDAQIAGNQRFPDGKFSIQEVNDKPENLGFYSYALYTKVTTTAIRPSSKSRSTTQRSTRNTSSRSSPCSKEPSPSER